MCGNVLGPKHLPREILKECTLKGVQRSLQHRTWILQNEIDSGEIQGVNKMSHGYSSERKEVFRACQSVSS
ncbi:hypothetical protein Plhal304r1_c026g0086701 [Plasmopara halstedii]